MHEVVKSTKVINSDELFFHHGVPSWNNRPLITNRQTMMEPEAGRFADLMPYYNPDSITGRKQHLIIVNNAETPKYSFTIHTEDQFGFVVKPGTKVPMVGEMVLAIGTAIADTERSYYMITGVVGKVSNIMYPNGTEEQYVTGFCVTDSTAFRCMFA